MRGLSTALGLAAALAVTAASIAPAEASCARRIINKSGYVALVSRDGGPWVAVRPHRSQTIQYHHSGRIDVALTCGPGALPEQAAYRASYDTVAIIDRCYIRFGDGFFEEQLGGGLYRPQGYRAARPQQSAPGRSGGRPAGRRLPGDGARCHPGPLLALWPGAC
ncbi:hypothetical protein M2437_001816 [Methylorubrum pseudosasae]|nr:hypothetical protein [Methylorubrum pseudosasae]